jgi:hypothetical protein
MLKVILKLTCHALAPAVGVAGCSALPRGSLVPFPGLTRLRPPNGIFPIMPRQVVQSV